ncbi:MAG: glycosyltransferase family 39 protein [Flavobacteriaceae bacterium]|nr:glycosyltransferase family 39 protein [Flavobacteriaceae bacterium]
MKIFWEKQPILFLVCVHLFVVLLRCLFVLYGNIDLHTEEAQYWTWSQHLDWSYYSKPPMVAYLNFLSEWLFGHSEFSVRINAIMLGFLTSIITYFFTQELFKDRKKSLFASLLVYAMPFYQGSALFFSTDSPLLFFCLLAMYLGWLAISYNKWKYWLGFSVALGLGYLSKYAMLFFIPSTLIFLLLTNKKTLQNKRFYLAILFSLAFFAPVVVWNFQHDFIGLKHIIHLSGAVAEKPNPLSRRLLKLLEYSSGQLAIISPLFLLFYWKSLRKICEDKRILYLWLPAVLSFCTFIFIAISKRSGANVNWTMFAYVGLPILLSHQIISMKKLNTGKILWTITVGIFVLLTQLPQFDNFLLPPKLDPFKKLSGWEEVAHTVDSLENTLTNKKVFVFADSYHIASELRFYNAPKPHYFYANNGNRMTQFDLWKGIEQFENQGYSGIFITKEDISKKNYIPQPQKPLPAFIAKAFDKNYRYHTHFTHYRGKKVTQFHIYILQNFKELRTKTINY